MPRNVRNFWIEATIDGQKTTLSGGPQGKDGGIYATLYQRSEGSIVKAATIEGFHTSAGQLILMVDVEGKDAVQFVTKR